MADPLKGPQKEDGMTHQVIWPLITLLGFLAKTTAADSTQDAALYAQACAACHGADGRGRPVEERGFEVELPDFTDCEFSSREPDPDWFAVVHEGGPVRAFDRMMPAFGDALSEEEIKAALRHVRSFCINDGWPRGEFNVPKALYTEKAFPEDEVLLHLNAGTGGTKAVEFKVTYENRFGPRGMMEGSVPVGWRDSPQGGGSNFGPGDVGLGYKYAFYHNLERGNALSIGGEIILPTGDEDEGFGSGSTILEPFAAYVHLLPGDAFFQAHTFGEFAVGGTSGDELALRALLGKTWTQGEFGRAWSPMVEVLISGELASEPDPTLDVVPQFQVALNTRQHILLSSGVRFPLHNRQGSDPQFVTYLLWDWFDGGFFDGW